MGGRRVSRKPRRNPLYTLFMSLLGLTVVLLVTVFVLNAKLRTARRDLADARTKIEQLQTGTSQSGSMPDDNNADGGTGDGTNSNDANTSDGDVIDWLDLTGHGEVQAAAKQDGWTFVAVGGQFGWINSDYLVTTRPAS